ncbi:amidase [Orrella sp. JC864]|uniref:amidase n=1 Tax=Orrella sp. JC864 TaxID=3120298 RepID=UPI003009F006
MDDVVFLPIEQLSGLLAQGQLGAEELTRAYLARIERHDGELRAYAQVHPELALAQARCADARRRQGLALGPLDGIPIAVKDLCGLAGQPMAAGSRTLAGRTAGSTATALQRLMQAGAVVLGSTQMVEYAFGAWGVNPLLGTPKNPWDRAVHRVPGGSSSGSGVAVAAGLAAAAIGSDTGGSIRTPSMLNGITGLKVSAGRISLAGCVDLCHTLDTLGPMARSAWDAALLAGVMAGPDPLDPRTLHRPQPAIAPAAPVPSALPLAGVLVATMPAARHPYALQPAFARAYQETVAHLQALGATLCEPEFPFDFREMTDQVGQIIACEGYALYEAVVQDRGAPMGEAVRQRMLGGAALAARDYLRLQAAHRAACAQWQAWMQDIDALLVPGLPITAVPLEGLDESSTALSLYTRPANFLGACALALPAGFDEAGLPLGVQLYGKPGDESGLVRIGQALQSATDWHLRHPVLALDGA